MKETDVCDELDISFQTTTASSAAVGGTFCLVRLSVVFNCMLMLL